MLAVIRVLPPPKGYLMGRRAKKGKIPLEIHTKKILNAEFLEIYATSSKKGINYEALENKINPLLGHIVIEYDVRPPSSSPIKQYDDSEFLSRLMLNFAVDCIGKAAEIKRFTVMLTDKDANCSGVAAELVKTSAEVIVVTEKPKEYQSCIKYCFEKYGAIVKVLSRYDDPLPADCVVAPYGMQGMRLGIRPAVIFSGGSEMNAYRVDKNSILFPEEILAHCGDKIPPTAFAAALCEEEGIFSLLKTMPGFLIRNDVKSDQKKIINQMIT